MYLLIFLLLLMPGVFLHDFRIKAEGMKVRTTRQNKANAANKDTFYWPDMTVRNIMQQSLYQFSNQHESC